MLVLGYTATRLALAFRPLQTPGRSPVAVPLRNLYLCLFHRIDANLALGYDFGRVRWNGATGDIWCAATLAPA
jgi:hypothetical protein